MHSFIAALTIVLFLSCYGIQDINVNVTNPDTAQTSVPNATQTEHDKSVVLTFEDSVSDHLPKFTFSVYENNSVKKEYEEYTYTIQISCSELAEYTPQSIEISSTENWKTDFRKHYITLVDIDFDGFADIQACTSQGVANVNYAYYRWNIFSGQGYGGFEREPFFEMLSIGYKLYPETKQILNTVKDNAVNHPRELYQLGDTQNGWWLGKYALIRHASQELIQGKNGEEIIIERVFFGDEEIYNESALVNGDIYDTKGIADNYLRFGVKNPIDIDTALKLIYQKYGKADEKYRL